MSSSARPLAQASRLAGEDQTPLARPVGQGLVGDRLLDVPHVEPVGDLVGKGLVQPSQELGLRHPERGVRPGAGEVDAAGVDPQQGREALPQQPAGRSRGRGRDDVHVLRGQPTGPDIEDRQRVVHAPEPPPAPVGIGRLPVDHVAEPVLPPAGVAVLDGLLPLGRQQRRDIAHGENDVHLGGQQRADGAVGLLRIRRREQLVRDDRDLARLLRLAGQDLPLAGPRPRRVAGQLRDSPQVLAGAEVVLRVMARQHDAARRELGPVAPHDLLEKGRAGLGLADVQEDLRPRRAAGTAASPRRRPGPDRAARSR